MRQQRVSLSLRIKHPTRDLSDVCKRLGFEPKHIWKKGDERRTPKGRKIGGLRESSGCSIELSRLSREPLAKQIEKALALLQPHRTILRRLSATGGTISFYIGWFCDGGDTGDTLGARVLDSLARSSIGLELNIYPPDANEGGTRVTPRS